MRSPIGQPAQPEPQQRRGATVGTATIDARRSETDGPMDESASPR